MFSMFFQIVQITALLTFCFVKKAISNFIEEAQINRERCQITKPAQHKVLGEGVRKTR